MKRIRIAAWAAVALLLTAVGLGLCLAAGRRQFIGIAAAVGQDRRSVRADDSRRQADVQQRARRQAVRGVLRLHALPGCLPDHAAGADQPHQEARPRCRPHALSLHHRRPRAGYARAAEGVSVEFRSQDHGAHGNAGGDRRRGESLPRHLPEGGDQERLHLQPHRRGPS